MVGGSVFLVVSVFLCFLSLSLQCGFELLSFLFSHSLTHILTLSRCSGLDLDPEYEACLEGLLGAKAAQRESQQRARPGPQRGRSVDPFASFFGEVCVHAFFGSI